MTTLLELAGVSKRFGDFEAVSDVSFHVGGGEVVGLLGANGAGKTTALRMALGLLAPSAGHVRLLGAEPGRDVRRRIGYVPQGLGLWADLTVRENLEFVASSYGRPRPEIPTSLADRAHDLVGRIPLGSQRELAFAAVLLHSPELLVLDEPTSGVGPLARASLWDTVHERADAGVGVLVTTHYMAEAQQCDRLLLMSAGRLAAQGSQEEIVGDTTAVVVTTDDWSRAFAVLSDAGLPVTLAGTAVRVADVESGVVARALSDAGVDAQVAATAASIEERMTVLAAADPGAGPDGG